ncbi:galanin receptor type 1-like [Orbicella faveolata]|uniref:galanin receptor type 1-like n=1 Tax=Orbicella faveolata TaxID=48498 RepID=UPI0009E25B66|nr:galanin receptor type 1-like [Orbicella faveolata]
MMNSSSVLARSVNVSNVIALNASLSTSKGLTLNLTAQSTTNKSISAEGFDRLAIVQMMCFPIITAAGLIGNTLICLAVFKRRRLRITDVFILNLAATDLATCVISIPFDFVEILMKQWPFGNVLCKTVYPLQTILMAVSVYTLLFMSWERHRSVMPPLKPKLKAKRAVAVVFFLWIASISLVGPYIAILRVEKADGRTECSESWPQAYHPKVFTLAVFIALYVLPLFVITANYIRISQKLWRDIQRMQKAIGEKNGNSKKPLTQARAQRNMRIVRIFILVVIAFSLCMLPNHIMWIWYDFGAGREYENFNTIIVFCFILVYSNSAINPFIFVFLHRRYCKGMFNSCSALKAFASSCLKSEVIRDNNCNRKGHGTTRRKKKIQKKNRKPYTMQVESPHKLYTARKEFWNNYWRHELIPKYEARRDCVAYRNVRNSFRQFKDAEDVNEGDDGYVAPLATRKVKVNFGEVVHIDEQRLLRQPAGETII